MEEQKECNMIANNNYHSQLIMNLARFRILKEIDQQEADERKINQKLLQFSYLDWQIKYKTQEIKDLECRGLGKVEPSSPIKSVPRTSGFLHLPGNDGPTPIRLDQRRCQKRLINKGQIDINYLQIVQEELLSSKTSYGMTLCGTQDLNNLIKSMMQRIKHGNKKRDDEIKIYHEIRNLKETRDLYNAPEPECYFWREPRSKRDTDRKRSIQHQINIRLDDIENIKRDLSGRKAIVRRVKAELQHVRKKIKSLKKEIKDVNSRRLKAYERLEKIKSLNKYNPTYMTPHRLVLQSTKEKSIT